MSLVSPCQRALGGLVSALKVLLYVLWTILSKVAISQFQSDTFDDKEGLSRLAVAVHHFLLK